MKMDKSSCFHLALPLLSSFEELKFPTRAASSSLGKAKAAHVQFFLPAFQKLKFKRKQQCAN